MFTTDVQHKHGEGVVMLTARSSSEWRIGADPLRDEKDQPKGVFQL